MNVQDLMKIIKLQDGKEVIKYLETTLADKYNFVISDYDNYIYFENKLSNTLLQAHVDTVKRKEPVKVSSRNSVLFSDEVLGADDRAGVWALTYLMKRCEDQKLEIPNLLFTNYEETGGSGMIEFVKATDKEMFGHIHMSIAMDRKGCGHYVTYNDNPRETKVYMSLFGWAEGYGTNSDISIFTEEYLIPAVNVSIGYHNEHTNNEILNLDELFLAINRVNKMLKKPIGERFEIKKKVVYVYDWRSCNNTQIELWDAQREKWGKKAKKKKGGGGDTKENYKVDYRYYGSCDFCANSGMVNYIVQFRSRLCDKCYEDHIKYMD